MRPVVRSLISPDEGVDPIERFVPPDPKRFSVLVSASIGPDDGPGEELFDVVVCSPLALAEQRRPEGFEFLHGVLVLDRWDPALVRRAIDEACARAVGETWHEVATSLSRWMDWEFADYRPYEGHPPG